MQRLGSGEAIKSQTNLVKRRKRPRVAVMADITYNILRKHSTPRQGSRCRGISSQLSHSRWMKKGPFCEGPFDR